MTIRVTRTVDVDATPGEIWEFIADPAVRARAISVVEDVEVTGERTATWHLRLPLRLVPGTVAVETEETHRDPPRYVSFVGRSSVMSVEGEHRLEATAAGTRIENRFVVDGAIPGIEGLFERRLDQELANLAAAYRAAAD